MPSTPKRESIILYIATGVPSFANRYNFPRGIVTIIESRWNCTAIHNIVLPNRQKILSIQLCPFLDLNEVS